MQVMYLPSEHLLGLMYYDNVLDWFMFNAMLCFGYFGILANSDNTHTHLTYTKVHVITCECPFMNKTEHHIIV